MASFDFSEVKDLANDMRRGEIEARRGGRYVVNQAAQRIVREWKQNARETARAHGKHYPNSIGNDGASWTGGAWVDSVGPDAAMPQGGMNFEYGSRNQDPHLDGNRAADGAEGPFAEAAARLGERALERVTAP